MTFTDWPWRHWCAHKADQPALRLNGESLSWSKLCQRTDALASGFIHQGVREGDGVMLLAHNHPDTLLAWLALLQCGARILPVNPQLPRSLLEILLPSMTLRFSLALNGEGGYGDLSDLTLTSMQGSTGAVWQPERLATMTLTSGSTGLPKAAVHTCAAHLASAEGVLFLLPYAGEDDWLLSLPLFHVSGQGILWRWLLAGARLTICEKQPLEQMLQGCTHASLVPTQLWRLLNAGENIALKAVLLGGAAIPGELTQRAASRGIRSWCGYGLTEFASTVCAKEADGKADVGVALPGREVKLVEGEVWLKAASMASGYWRDGRLVSITNAQGWFATRDRGEITDGRLTILGRMDNLFFSGGEGIQPEELERVIATHPQVSQVYVVPLDDAEFGQRPVAVVECETGADIAQLPHWLSDKLARFQQPVHWLVLPAELKNGGIKVSRRTLQQWVQQSLKG